jgi:hypothetical protein
MVKEIGSRFMGEVVVPSPHRGDGKVEGEIGF